MSKMHNNCITKQNQDKMKISCTGAKCMNQMNQLEE